MRALPLLLVVLLAATPGCALKSRDTTEQPTPLEPFEQTLRVQRAWSLSLAGAGVARVGLAPVVSGDEVIAAGHDGRVVAVSLVSGRLVWENRLRSMLTAGPGVGEGLVAVATQDGQLVVLDRGSGNERWRVTLSTASLGVPAIVRGVVAVRTGDGQLIGHDAANGDVLWRTEQPVPSLTLRGHSGVVVVGEVFVAGFANGRLLGVLARDGQTVWEAALGTPSGRTEIERMVDITATPRVFGRDIFAVGYQGQIAGIVADSGRALWGRNLSSVTGLGVDGLGVWVTDADSEVWGLDRISGSNLWRQGALRARQVSAPASGDGWVVVGDFEGWLHFLSQEDGRLIARVRADRGAIHMAPVAVGNRVVVQGSGGSLAVYTVGD